jgi:hypothetical protein
MKTILLTIATTFALNFSTRAQSTSNPNNKLPAKLTSFTATLDKNTKAALTWTTESEINLNYFVLEKSLDGVDYADAALVFSYGNMTDRSDYSFTDDLAQSDAQVIYYRLRLVNIDGKTQYSPTRIIRITIAGESNLNIASYPNPVSSALRITIPAEWQNKKVEYELLTNNGQSALKTISSAAGQTETIDIANLAPGFYFVHVSCGTESANQKIIKQ